MRNVGVGGPGSFQDGRGHGRFRVTEELHKNACNVLSFQRGEEETTAVRAAGPRAGRGRGRGTPGCRRREGSWRQDGHSWATGSHGATRGKHGEWGEGGPHPCWKPAAWRTRAHVPEGQPKARDAASMAPRSPSLSAPHRRSVSAGRMNARWTGTPARSRAWKGACGVYIYTAPCYI